MPLHTLSRMDGEKFRACLNSYGCSELSEAINTGARSCASTCQVEKKFLFGFDLFSIGTENVFMSDDVKLEGQIAFLQAFH